MVCQAFDYDSKLIKRDLTKYVGVKEKKIDTIKIDKYLYPKKLVNTQIKYGIIRSVAYFKKAYK